MADSGVSSEHQKFGGQETVQRWPVDHLGELKTFFHGCVQGGEDGVAAVAEDEQAGGGGDAAPMEERAPLVEPYAVYGPQPENACEQDEGSEHAAEGNVGESADVPRPGGREDDHGREEDEGALAADGGKAGEVQGGAGEELLEVVSFHDEELDGDEVELEVHESGDGDAALVAESELADVWVGLDELVGVHATAEEEACVVADAGDEQQHEQAQPPAVGQGVWH